MYTQSPNPDDMLSLTCGQGLLGALDAGDATALSI
jgi:hypothetical protein